MRQWKAAWLELEEIKLEFRLSEESGQYELRDRFDEVKHRGDELRKQAIEQAASLYAESPQIVPDLANMLNGLPEKLYAEHDYRLAALAGNAVIRHDPGNSQLIFDTFKSAFFGNEFDLANETLERWTRRHGSPPDRLLPIVEVLALYRKAWEKELERRAAADNEPLPQIELETEKGAIVVALYEDDFPQIVGNIVSFVESRDLYREGLFFEVLADQTVRSGCPRNDGTTRLPLGRMPNLRPTPDDRGWHFRGVFSLVVVPGDNMAITQFFITRIPMPNMDGNNLVVGYIDSGMEVVDSLTETHELNEQLQLVPLPEIVPDRITAVRVLRKRDHEYNFRLDEPVEQGN